MLTLFLLWFGWLFVAADVLATAPAAEADAVVAADAKIEDGAEAVAPSLQVLLLQLLLLPLSLRLLSWLLLLLLALLRWHLIETLLIKHTLWATWRHHPSPRRHLLLLTWCWWHLLLLLAKCIWHVIIWHAIVRHSAKRIFKLLLLRR